MSDPADAPVYLQVIDPSDFRPFLDVLRRGSDGELNEGEEIESFTIAPTPSAISAGLTISNIEGKRPIGDDNLIGFWPRISEGLRASPIFDPPGLQLGVEINVTTTLGQVIQRTKKIHVRHR